jgi:hypothetical protein
VRAVPVPVMVVGVLVLVALGLSGLHGVLEDEREALVLEPNDRPTAVRLGTLDDEPSPAPPTLPSVPVLAPGTSLARSRGESASAAEAGDDLSAEMRLLAEARRTMGEDPSGALSLLDQHRERYPRGALREERDAYRIMLLRRLSHTDEAERGLIDFRDDFPESHFLPMLRGE